MQVCIGDLGLRWGGDVVGMGGDRWGWVLGIIVVAGTGDRQYFFVTFRLHFGSILGVFGWILGASGFRLGSDWAQWLQIGVSAVTFGASSLQFVWAWELLDCLWRSLGVNLGASGIQNGCCRRQG